MILPSKNWRTYSALQRALPAKAIRSRFLDYFLEEKGHQFVKSAPVLSQFDSSIPFVNAGMCQFKGVFTGEDSVDFGRAANSQKCVRVGGKHNDLNVIGLNSFHHTFFEMLGNWSFGSYGKKEACSLAWELLTTPPFSIPPTRMFVTYFAGNGELGMPADEEVREIWLELGVPPDRILPFSARENFWEMGVTGPCGPCTEIHVAFTDEMSARPDLVNVGNPLLAELWNIVFIKFNKTDTGIETLPREFIDTGMGFERLASLLQNKTSNYDTDLFQPLFQTIQKVSKCPPYAGSFDKMNLDYAYRRLADFSRMITVVIADDVFPDIHAKVRRILRKALSIATIDFKQKSPEILLGELAERTAESLSETYPELGENLKKVKLIIDDEALLIDNLMISNELEWEKMCEKHPILHQFSVIEYPGLLSGYTALLQKLKYLPDESRQISSDFIVNMYNTYGLDDSVMRLLTTNLNFEIDWEAVQEIIAEKRSYSKRSLKDGKFELDLQRIGIKTDDSWKHNFTRTAEHEVEAEYLFPDLEAKILAVLKNNSLVSVSTNEKLPNEFTPLENAEVDLKGSEFGIVFDRTNFSYETERRRFDKGFVVINGKRIGVSEVKKFNNCIVHFVTANSDQSVKVKAGMEATLQLDSKRRLNIMKNNVLSCLILFILREMFPLLYLQYDNTEDEYVNLRLCVHGPELNLREIATTLEKKCQSYIKDGLPVEKTIIPSKTDLIKLPALKLRPCWTYPSKNIELISIVDKKGKVVVREPSTDVYVQNTADLEDCLILFLEKVGEHILSVTGFTGNSCKDVKEFNRSIEKKVASLGKRVDHALKKSSAPLKILEVTEHALVTMYELLETIDQNKNWVSLETARLVETVEKLEPELSKRVNQVPIQNVEKFINTRMQKQAKKQKCVVYFNMLYVDDLKTREFVTNFIKNQGIPVLFITYIAKRVRGYCYVPEHLCTENFNSEIWMQLTMDETKIPFKIVADEISYPGFRFLSHFSVKKYKLDTVRNTILTQGVAIANELMK